MTMLLGRKIGMTQIYDDKGVIVPVTVIQAGPCKVLQVKNAEKDGYAAVQLGIGDVKPARRKKPEIGHCKAASCAPKRFIREMRLDADSEHNVGDELTVELFEEIKYVDVVGTTKGKGFAGVMKRHGFKGMPASHGTERMHRHGGSISVAPGATGRSIKKGKRMAGHMGHVRCSTQSQALIAIDRDNNLLLVKGSVPGPRNSYVVVSQAVKKN